MTHAPLELRLGVWRNAALGVGGVGSALTIFGFIQNRQQFFESYLLAFVFWACLSLGLLAITLLHNLTGGQWGRQSRPIFFAGVATLKLLPLLFVPILLGMHDLYEWSHGEFVANDPILLHKAGYLNPPFFIIRATIYFVIWLGIAHGMSRWFHQRAKTGDEALTRRIQLLSGPSLVIYFFTVSFAFIDWCMSLTPHWYSTIYGMWFIVAQGLVAFAFVIGVATRVVPFQPFSHYLERSVFQDLSTLLFAFIMLWAYFSFSQFLIIWSGNLPEETPWVLARFQGPWAKVGIFLLVAHFLLPFFLLLSRQVKGSPRFLWPLATIFFALRYVDLAWFIKPAFENIRLFHWLDPVIWLTLGGGWLAYFSHVLPKQLILFAEKGVAHDA